MLEVLAGVIALRMGGWVSVHIRYKDYGWGPGRIEVIEFALFRSLRI